MNQSRDGYSCLSSTDHLTGMSCSCTLCVLDQKPGSGRVTCICMDVSWGMSAPWCLLLLLPIVSFTGTWMVCFYLALLSLSGLIKIYSPGQSSRNSCFRGKEGGITSLLCSVAHRSLSHLNSVFLEGPRVLILLQSLYGMIVWFDAVGSELPPFIYFRRI